MFCLGGPRFHQLLYVFWVWKPALIGFFFGSKFQTKMWADFFHFKNLFCLLLKGSLVPNSSLFHVTPNGYSMSSKKGWQKFSPNPSMPPLPYQQKEQGRQFLINIIWLFCKKHTQLDCTLLISFFIKNMIFSKLFFVKTHRGSVFSLAFLS